MGVAILGAGTLGLLLLAACGAVSPVAPASAPDTKLCFDQKSAWEFLVKQCDFGPRPVGSEAHIKTRDYIAGEMKKSCDSVRLQETTHVWSKTGNKLTMWNIIGDQNWTDAKVRVVLLAHWDTRPTADYDPDPQKTSQPILGANDGASGVAVLLELMRAVKGKLPKDLGVLYLMTDGEDLGPSVSEMFLGAIHFSKNLPSPKPDYGILLDMIGDKNLVVPVEPNSAVYARDLLQAFYRNAASNGLGATFPQEYGPTISDDHMSLNDAGVPTIDLIDFDYGPDHSWWHTTADTPDKCSADSLGKIGKALESWLLKDPVWRLRGK